jgi:hypothetical protein
MRILDNLWLVQDAIHLGAVIFEKLINDIKAKLPSKKKAKEDELDDDTEIKETGDATDPGVGAADKTGVTDISALNDKPQTFIDKIKSKLIPKKKGVSDPDETSVGESTSIGEVKSAKKKKINPIVLVVVLGALGIFLFYEPEPEQVAVAPPPRKSLRKTPTVTPTEVPAETPTDTTTEVPKETPPDTTAQVPAETPTDLPTDPTDTASTDTKIETPTDTTTETPTDTTTETPTDTTTETPTDTTTETPTDTTTETPTDTTTETPTDTTTETPTDTTTETPADTTTETPKDTTTDIPIDTSTDSVDGTTTDTDESTMTDKILEDLEKQVKKDQPKEVKKEYVSPPDYEYRGRGLVYNCTGKHWACVDGPSYKSCEDNFSSTTYKKKPIECYPFNVYNSTKGCELMQNRVVSSNAKTGFCKGN